MELLSVRTLNSKKKKKKKKKPSWHLVFKG